MKEILLRLAEGKNRFECQHKGTPNFCKILKIDLETNMVFVAFEKPILKECTVKKELPFSNEPDEHYFERQEIEAFEDWISVKID